MNLKSKIAASVVSAGILAGGGAIDVNSAPDAPTVGEKGALKQSVPRPLSGRKGAPELVRRPLHPALTMLLSARLRHWRRSRNLPLKQIAADLGVSVAVISAWERGTRFPSAAHLEWIADYLGVPVWRLFYPETTGEGNAPAAPPNIGVGFYGL